MNYWDYAPQGSEVPEVLLGLCLYLYALGNLKRAAALGRLRESRPHKSFQTLRRSKRRPREKPSFKLSLNLAATVSIASPAANQAERPL